MKTKPLLDIKEDAKRRYDAILEVSYNYFIQKGVKGLNIRDIAKSVKIHPPVIYQLFGGKEGLVYELSKRLVDDIEEKLLHTIDTHTHPLLKMTQYGVNYINVGIHNPALFQFVLNYNTDILSDSTGEQQETAFVIYQNALSKFMSYLRSFIKELYELGAIDKSFMKEGSASEVIDSLTINLWAGVHGLTALAVNRIALEKTFGNFYDSFLSAFSYNANINQQFLEENGEIALAATEIIMSLNI